MQLQEVQLATKEKNYTAINFYNMYPVAVKTMMNL